MISKQTSHLKLNPIAVIADIHWTTWIHHNLLYECFQSVLKITCWRQDVPSDVFMLGGVLAQEVFNTHIIDENLLLTISKDVSDLLVLQKGGEVFIEAVVSTAQGEEHVERTTVLHLGKQLELLLGPISKSINIKSTVLKNLFLSTNLTELLIVSKIWNASCSLYSTPPSAVVLLAPRWTEKLILFWSW